MQMSNVNGEVKRGPGRPKGSKNKASTLQPSSVSVNPGIDVKNPTPDLLNNNDTNDFELCGHCSTDFYSNDYECVE